MIVKDIIPILKKSNFFMDQSDNLLYAIAFAAEKISFSTGDLLIKTEEIKPICIVILSGNVFIQKRSRPIKVSSGSVLGLLSLINDSKPNNAVIAGSTGEALKIDSKLFNKLISQFPDFVKKLQKCMVDSLNVQIETLEKVIDG